MTDNNHPITPPPELFAEWLAEAKRLHPNESLGFISGQIAQLAYRAGADMELEACREWLKEQRWEALAIHLRDARRPKPPSLKERGREALQNIHAAVVMETGGRELDVLKEIVESLPD